MTFTTGMYVMYVVRELSKKFALMLPAGPGSLYDCMQVQQIFCQSWYSL